MNDGNDLDDLHEDNSAAKTVRAEAERARPGRSGAGARVSSGEDRDDSPAVGPVTAGEQMKTVGGKGEIEPLTGYAAGEDDGDVAGFSRSPEMKSTEARLAAVRERTERQKRMALLGGGGLLLLLAIGGAVSLRRTAAVPPPNVTIVWPSPQKFGQRTFPPVASGATASNKSTESPYSLATVVIRRGQPFTVLIDNADRWAIKAVSDGSKNSGGKITWAPVQEGKLKLFCRPAVGGWKRLFAWALPNYELRIEGLAPKTLPDGRLQLIPSKSAGPVWITAQILADGAVQPISWDESALTAAELALKSAESVFPKGSGASSPHWTLRNAFDAKAARPTGDNGTYLYFNGTLNPNVAVDLATVMARTMAKSSPKTSIKFIVSEERLAPGERTIQSEVTFRLAFDGSSSRGGWIKHAGETAATPLRWWDTQLGNRNLNRISPSLPRR